MYPDCSKLARFVGDTILLFHMLRLPSQQLNRKSRRRRNWVNSSYSTGFCFLPIYFSCSAVKLVERLICLLWKWNSILILYSLLNHVKSLHSTLNIAKCSFSFNHLWSPNSINQTGSLKCMRENQASVLTNLAVYNDHQVKPFRQSSSKSELS